MDNVLHPFFSKMIWKKTGNGCFQLKKKQELLCIKNRKQLLLNNRGKTEFILSQNENVNQNVQKLLFPTIHGDQDVPQ
jgi:hypothetical protein